MPAYGWTGLAVILVAEALLFGGAPVIGTYFTPVVWIGYILFADGWVFARRGRSLLTTGRHELPVLLPFSIGSWLIFEGYNLLLKNWYYVDLPLPQPLRLLGFAWAFATILPALRETADLLEAHGAFATWRVRPIFLSPRAEEALLALGGALLLYPILFPSPYLFGLVWVGFILLCDPLNRWLGAPSLLGDLREGKTQTFWCWFVGGTICGVLWEFWNYWAAAKWHYTVPITAEWKIFEMPVAGYLGFGPFAVECYLMYNLAVLLGRRGLRRAAAGPERGAAR
ncbi:MAG: hypothetical protein L0214_07335 [candidate division NC10 bacterium]|nr:hypothetical protein [candidate division NC10 bacterium]